MITTALSRPINLLLKNRVCCICLLALLSPWLIAADAPTTRPVVLKGRLTPDATLEGFEPDPEHQWVWAYPENQLPEELPGFRVESFPKFQVALNWNEHQKFNVYEKPVVLESEKGDVRVEVFYHHPIKPVFNVPRPNWGLFEKADFEAMEFHGLPAAVGRPPSPAKPTIFVVIRFGDRLVRVQGEAPSLELARTAAVNVAEAIDQFRGRVIVYSTTRPAPDLISEAEAVAIARQEMARRRSPEEWPPRVKFLPHLQRYSVRFPHGPEGMTITGVGIDARTGKVLVVMEH